MIQSSPSSPGLIFVTPVWGRSHVELFLNVCLPSLLTPKNLGNSTHHNSRYLIFTDRESISEIESHPVLKKLKTFIHVELREIDREQNLSNHELMSKVHKIALIEGYKLALGTVFIPPDTVWSHSSIQNMTTIIREKKVHSIHISGMRLLKETFYPEVLQFCKKNILSLASRDLVRLALKHLHPINDTHFFEEKKSTKLLPANLIWKVENVGLLAHCFHLHPLYISPDRRNLFFQSTIDDDLCAANQENFYVVQDSDEILTFEISPATHLIVGSKEKGSIEGIVQWYFFGANQFHLKLLNFPIRLHSDDLRHPAWKKVEARSSIIIEKIISAINKKEENFLYRLAKNYLLFYARKAIFSMYKLNTRLLKKSFFSKLLFEKGVLPPLQFIKKAFQGADFIFFSGFPLRKWSFYVDEFLKKNFIEKYPLEVTVPVPSKEAVGAQKIFDLIGCNLKIWAPFIVSHVQQNKSEVVWLMLSEEIELPTIKKIFPDYAFISSQNFYSWPLFIFLQVERFSIITSFKNRNRNRKWRNIFKLLPFKSRISYSWFKKNQYVHAFFYIFPLFCMIGQLCFMPFLLIFLKFIKILDLGYKIPTIRLVRLEKKH